MHPPHEVRGTLHGAADVGVTVGWEVRAEEAEGAEHGGRAFWVGVLDHAAVDELGGDEELEGGAGTGALVGAEALVGVLHGEEGVGAVVEAADGDEGWKSLGELNIRKSGCLLQLSCFHIKCQVISKP